MRANHSYDRADDTASQAPSALDEAPEDRAPVAARAEALADRRVAQLKADGADAGLDEASEGALEVEGLDDAVEAATTGEETADSGAAGTLDESAATQAPEPTAPAADDRAQVEPEAAPAAAAPTTVPEEARAGIEATAQTDLSTVRVFAASPLAEEMGAVALTMGDEIHLAPNAPAPGSAAGDRLLAHELTHVVQQREGRVDGEDGAVNDDADLEAEADAAEQAPARTTTAASAAADSAAAPVQRKGKPKKSKAVYESAATLRGKSLGEFLGYVQGQLDWAVKVAPADKKPLQELLTWTSRSTFIGGGCSKIKVDELIGGGVNRAAVEAYAKAVSIPSKAPTAKMDSVDNIVEAEAIGVELLKLHTAIDGRCLYHISNPYWMNELIKGGLTDALVKYVTMCKPALHAPDGRELESFVLYAREVGDPTKYKSTLPKIRNYHRFEPAGLDTLAGNFGDTSKSRPMGLILHTAVDWNGAFHRDPHLTALINHPRNLMLMVEGYGSLSDYQAEIKPLAQKHGRDGKIDQVMIAGHGNATSMELAGEVAPGTEDSTPTMHQSKNDGLDLNGAQSAKTQAFFDEIIANMEEEPSWPFLGNDDQSRRVVFNACLTAANDIAIEDEATSGVTYEDQIKSSLATNPSLTTAFEQRAADQGNAVDAVGANGSFGSIELQEATMRLPFMKLEPDENGVMQPVMSSFPIQNGKMDLASEGDPALTSSKMEYLEKGDDPPGVMMALLEVWTRPSGGTEPWQTAADNHINAADETWKDTQSKTFLEIVRAKYNGNLAAIKKLSDVAHALEFLDNAPGQGWIAEKLAASPDAAAIIAGLDRTTDEIYYEKVVIGHARAIIGKGNELMAELNVGWKADRLLQVIDAPLLDKHGVLGGLLTPTDSPTEGQIILAAADIFKSGGTPASKAFFMHLLQGASKFRADLEIGEKLGDMTEDMLLDALGVGTAPVSVENETANVNLDGGKNNEAFLQEVNLPGTVTADSLNVRARPSKSAASIGELKAGDTVFVVGRSGEWLAIDYQSRPTRGRTAFVHQDYVTVA